MAKTWEQMTEVEKVEDLRRDVKSLFLTINSLSLRIDTISNQATTNFTRMAEMIDKINDRLKKALIPEA